jgi:predicted PurR-regulated permease PerM
MQYAYVNQGEGTMIAKTDTTIQATLLFLAGMALLALLYFTRELLAPFALAIFTWLIIDAFARWMDDLSPKIPYWLALTTAVLVVVGLMVGFIFVIVDTVGDVVKDVPRYEARLTEIFSWIADKTGQENMSFNTLDESFKIKEKIRGGLGTFAASVQGVLSEFFLIALYIVFLFAAQSTFPKKMDDLFPNVERRAQAAKVGERIRASIEKYLSVQTIISLLQTVISYIGMTALGLDNALFWALVIFVLNYIPIVGGLLAVLFPVLFAIVQFDSPGRIAILAGVLFGAQTIIGNTIQPKMMGDSMNLSALVVILALSVWGALWGGVGAFLSAPLTVIIMIILAQFPTTRWIAVLLSANGDPDMEDDPDEDADEPTPIPSL